MARFDRHRWTALAGLAALGLYGAFLGDRLYARDLRVALDRGRRLYWQVRRTEHVHEPFELVDQLMRRTEDTRTVIEALALEPGEVVADVGCGSGYFTFDLARQVGRAGTVWSLDIQEESLAFLQLRLDSRLCPDCGKVELLHSRVDDAMLAPASVDAMLMVNLDFYAFEPLLPESARMLASCLRALRPGGRLVVVQDLCPIPGGSPGALERNLAAAGFALEHGEDLTANSVLRRFRKP